MHLLQIQDQTATKKTDKCVKTEKSHLSHAVCDSGLERKICAVLDASDDVVSWVKNHKLYLEIPYQYFGNTYRHSTLHRVFLNTWGR
jgi:hypothetical protein